MSEVLQSLNIDQSFFVQFAIVIFLFFSLKYFLFDKLNEVLVQREEKTTGLLSLSVEKEEEAKKLSEQIESQIMQTKSELSNEVKMVKNQLLAQKEKEYNELEESLDQEYKLKINDFNSDLSKNFEVLKSNTNSLANDLVNKIIQ